MKRCLSTKLYRWIDRRGRIPRWVFWFWRHAHWCPEMDSLLILDNPEDCFCDHCPRPPYEPPSADFLEMFENDNREKDPR